MSQEKILNAFNKFAGKEVTVVPLPHMGRFHEYQLDQSQEIIQELHETAKDMGLDVRVWMPNSMGTRDYRVNRLNVHIEQEKDGKWRIQKRMNLG